MALDRQLIRMRAQLARCLQVGNGGRSRGSKSAHLRRRRRDDQVVERETFYARFYGFETLFGTERARRLELRATVIL